MRANLKSAVMISLEFLSLLSAMVATSAAASPDDAHQRSPPPANLAGQTLKIASDELVSTQLRPLSCVYHTLASRSANADLIFIASQQILEPADDREKTRVTVDRVLKSTEKVTLNPGDALKLPEEFVPQDSLVVLVFCQQDGERGMAITEGEPISRELADHLAMLSTFSDPLARFEYLLGQEHNPDSSIALNVFYELTSTSEETLDLIANGIPRQRVISGLPVLGTSIGRGRSPTETCSISSCWESSATPRTFTTLSHWCLGLGRVRRICILCIAKPQAVI